MPTIPFCRPARVAPAALCGLACWLLSAAVALADNPPAGKAEAGKETLVRSAGFDILLALGDSPKAKVGTAMEKEVRKGDEVHISMDADMTIGRGKTAVNSVSKTLYVENAAGALLRFNSTSTTSGPVTQNKIIEGVVDGKTVKLSVGNGKDEPTKKDVKWPEGAITLREMDRRLRQGGLTVGKKIEAKVFPTPEDPEEAHTCKAVVEAKETIKFLDKDVEAWRVKATVDLFGQEINTLTWMNAEGESYRVEMDLGNVKISFLRTK